MTTPSPDPTGVPPRPTPISAEYIEALIDQAEECARLERVELDASLRIEALRRACDTHAGMPAIVEAALGFYEFLAAGEQ